MLVNSPYELKNLIENHISSLTNSKFTEIVKGVDGVLNGCNCNVRNLALYLDKIYVEMGEWITDQDKRKLKEIFSVDKVEIIFNGKVIVVF